MRKDQLFDIFLTLGLMATSTYLGYLWGTNRMADAYGEVMSAEAIMYLAELDSRKE